MDMRRKPEYLQRWGLWAAFQAAFLDCLRRSLGLHVYGIYTRRIDPSKSPGASPVGFTYRIFLQGEADELIATARHHELDLTPAFVRHALEKGDICDAILHDGAVVSYGWSAFTPTHDADGVYAGFPGNCRYGYKSFTLPEYRGLHLPRAFKPLRDQYCVNARGCTHSIGFIAIQNRSSIHAALAQGNLRIGYAGYLKRGPIFWPFGTPGARKHGFHFFVPIREGN